MGKTIKNYRNLLLKGKYNELYILLEQEQFEYTLDNLVINFSVKNNQDLFCYLLYVLSICKEVKIYLLICDFLMFQDIWFADIIPIIKWFLDSALQLYPNNVEIAEWILSVFKENPESPYTEGELLKIKNWLRNTGNYQEVIE